MVAETPKKRTVPNPGNHCTKSGISLFQTPETTWRWDPENRPQSQKKRSLAAPLFLLRSSDVYQIEQAFGRTIFCGTLHPKARANSGMFETGPFTRQRAAA